ncbi:Winged helix-turn-helix DNA-binding domain-containing protein [Acholeplasma oculi]|uniref:Winged helix-turn-helix DNA-binding domain-containing protein n=1 Tax=Acholeplasma oculi TaxID=35623 RepID=A0A061AAM9_9MOLU|nr:hypothetical protein [Acholeplasma oculi]CDR30955.1 Winged helix-turn-helix DNA-binding domain-containing protein [Acholeplasma oculi]
MDKKIRLLEIELQTIKNLEKEPFLTLPELSVKIKKSLRQTSRIIHNLKEKNIIERVGSRKTGYWGIIK